MYSKALLIFITICVCACNYDSKCEIDPSAKDGLNIKYYEDGKPRKVFQLKDCLLEGLDIEFYANGRLKRYGYASAGKKEGIWILFDSTGIYLTKQGYKKGNFTFASNENGTIILDSNFILKAKDIEINLSRDTLIKKSHISEFFIRQINSDSIYLEAEKKTVLFDKNLNILSETVKVRSY